MSRLYDFKRSNVYDAVSKIISYVPCEKERLDNNGMDQFTENLFDKLENLQVWDFVEETNKYCRVLVIRQQYCFDVSVLVY